MILKIIVLICLYFLFKNFFKAMRIINQHNENQKKNPNHQSNSFRKENSKDIVDAEYRVIKD